MLRPSRVVARLAAGVALAAGLAAIHVAPVAADCDGSVPSFREHAKEAKRVVIGEVVAVDMGAPWTDDEGRSSRFTLQVRYVLRGAPEPTLALRDLEFLSCADHIITARPGDQIALALDATGFSPPRRFSTVAWVDGEPFAEDIERITVREAFQLLGLPPPEDEVQLVATSDPPLALAILAIAIVGGVLGIMRVRSRRLNR